MPPRRQKKSRKQEQAFADRIGGGVTAGSGSGWSVKNDVRTDTVSWEVKYTDAKSYSLKRADLEKAENQALLDSGRDFGFMVGFGKKGSLEIEREYVILSRETYEGMIRGNSEPSNPA